VRRSAQTAALRLCETVALLLTPICPFTAEEVWETLPGRAGESPALETYSTLRLPRLAAEKAAAWDRLLAIRAEAQAILEPLRRDGTVGSSAQAHAWVPEAARADASAAGLDDERFAELLIVPSITWHAGELRLAAAEGSKCARCWQVRPDVDAAGLCGRCRGVLGERAA
jgi:isoleucyl-tRNA synthetase